MRPPFRWIHVVLLTAAALAGSLVAVPLASATEPQNPVCAPPSPFDLSHSSAAADSYDRKFGESISRPLEAQGVRANDYGIDLFGDVFELFESTITILTVAPAHGTVELNDNGSFVYTPAVGYAGVDYFTYVLQDTENQLCSDTAVVTLNAATYDPPTTVYHDGYETPMDTPLVVNAPGVLAGASDPYGFPLAAQLAAPPTRMSCPDPCATTEGTVAVNPNGSFTYTPSGTYVGSVIFLFKACRVFPDPPGCSRVDFEDHEPKTHYVIVKMLEVPDRVAGAPDAYQVNENGVLVAFGDKGDFANDFNNTGDPMTATVDQFPAHGVLEFQEDGMFSYIPLPRLLHRRAVRPAGHVHLHAVRGVGVRGSRSRSRSGSTRSRPPRPSRRLPDTRAEPFVIDFVNPEGQVQDGVTNVNATNLTITPEGSAESLTGDLVCFDAADEVVDGCAAGVKQVFFRPDAYVPHGQTYILGLNQSFALGPICQSDIFAACVGTQTLNATADIPDVTSPTMTLTPEVQPTGNGWYNASDLGEDGTLEVTATPADEAGGSGLDYNQCLVYGKLVAIAGGRVRPARVERRHAHDRVRRPRRSGQHDRPAVDRDLQGRHRRAHDQRRGHEGGRTAVPVAPTTEQDVTLTYICGDPGPARRAWPAVRRRRP